MAVTHAASTANKPDLGTGLIKAIIDPTSIPPATNDNLGPILIAGSIGLIILMMVLH